MIARGRARLLMGARAVTVSLNYRFEKSLDLSLRKNGYIADPRIPGGEAIGKIVSYTIEGDGSGKFISSVKLACAVGVGGAIETAPGTADYVDETYVDDYQTYTGQIIALPSADITFSPPVLVAGGEGGVYFPISKSDVVIRAEVMGSPAEQAEIIGNTIKRNTVIDDKGLGEGTGPATQHSIYFNAQAQKLANALASAQQWFELELRDLTGPGIDAHWEVTTFPMVVPQQIDLTADSSI